MMEAEEQRRHAEAQAAAENLRSQQGKHRSQVSPYKIITVVMHARGLVARAVSRAQTRARMHHYVYYPDAEHARTFASSNLAMRPEGPAEDFPGSIGSLKVVDEGDRWRIINLQGHFKIGTPAALTPQLARQYAAWRERLLEAAFEEAKTRKIKNVIFDITTLDSDPEERVKSAARSRQVFEKIARQSGYDDQGRAVAARSAKIGGPKAETEGSKK